MWCRYRRLTAAGIAVLASAASLQSQGSIDAQARAAFDKMGAAFKAADALHVKVVWVARYTGGASADDFPFPGPDTLEFKMRRPNKLFLDATTSREGKRWRYMIVSDGTSLSYWRTAKNQYWQTKAPATFAEMPKLLPDDAIGTMTDSGWDVDSILEWDLLTDDTYISQVTAGAMLVSFSGPEDLRGAKVNLVRVATPRGAPINVESRLYLDVEHNLARGMALSMSGQHPDTGRNFTVEMQAAYETFNVRPTFGASDFTFVPPPGSKRAGGF
jgi:hypothetical protein